MSILKQEARVIARIGEPKAKKDGTKEIPMVLVIPDSECAQSLTVSLYNFLLDMQNEMVNPHIQGSIPKPDEDEEPVFEAWFWPMGESPSVQEEHFKNNPVLHLENVKLGRYTAYPMGDYEGSVGISIKMEFPISTDKLAGSVDRLAGESMYVQIATLQVALENV